MDPLEKRLAEWQKLVRNPRRMLERWYTIPTKKGPPRPFKLKRNQRKIVGAWLLDYFGIPGHREPRPVRHIRLKYRQGGISTIDSALNHLISRFTPGFHTLVTGHSKTSTGWVYGMYRRHENFLQQKIKAKGGVELLEIPMFGAKLGNAEALQYQLFGGFQEDPKTGEMVATWIESAGSGIHASVSDFASVTARQFHITEVGKNRSGGSDTWESLMEVNVQCIPEEPQTSIVLEGTAERPSGFFFDMYFDAVAGRNDFRAFFYPFFSDEELSIPLTKDEESRIDNGEDCIVEPIGSEWWKRHYDGDPTGITVDQQAADEKELNRIRGVISEYGAWGINKLRRRHRPERFQKRIQFLIKQRESALKWRQLVGLMKRCQGKMMAFRRQYPSSDVEAFTSTGSCMFDEVLIAARVGEAHRQAEERRGKETKYPVSFNLLTAGEEESSAKPVTIWHPPEPDTEYWIGVDCSRGYESGDPSRASVFNVNKLRQEAVWHGWKNPGRFAADVSWMGKYYRSMAQMTQKGELAGGREAEVIIDVTGGIGAQVQDALKGLDYYSLYMHLKAVGIYSDYGFNTTPTNRNKGLTCLQIWLPYLTIEDVDFWVQLRSFGPGDSPSGKPRGLDGANDDYIAVWLMLAFVAGERRMITLPESAEREALGLPIVDPLGIDLRKSAKEETEEQAIDRRYTRKGRRNTTHPEKPDWRLGYLTRPQRETALHGTQR